MKPPRDKESAEAIRERAVREWLRLAELHGPIAASLALGFYVVPEARPNGPKDKP